MNGRERDRFHLATGKLIYVCLIALFPFNLMLFTIFVDSLHFLLLLEFGNGCVWRTSLDRTAYMRPNEHQRIIIIDIMHGTRDENTRIDR